ncbi:MAG: 16S rRNA (guanine(966)-N(2))-methyltransferase RsmD [Candidatus Omnitrophota bacterium]
MKIITGEFKGRNFYMPAHVKPTQNIVRKAIFDLIGQDLTGFSFLDLFAGSGAIGLEAFSCGAREVLMVERDPKCIEVIRQNLELFGLTGFRDDGRSCRLMEGDVFAVIKSLAGQKKCFDVVFLDPPYDGGLAKKTLKTLSAYAILHPNSVILTECSEKEGLPYAEHDFEVMTERKYGKSCLVLYKQKQAN